MRITTLGRIALVGGASAALAVGLTASASASEAVKRTEENREVELVIDDTDPDPFGLNLRPQDVTFTNMRPTVTNTHPTFTNTRPGVTNTIPTNTVVTATNTRATNTRATNTRATNTRGSVDDRSRNREVRDWTLDGGDGWTRDLTRDLTDDRTRNNTR